MIVLSGGVARALLGSESLSYIKRLKSSFWKKELAGLFHLYFYWFSWTCCFFVAVHARYSYVKFLTSIKLLPLLLILFAILIISITTTTTTTVKCMTIAVECHNYRWTEKKLRDLFTCIGALGNKKEKKKKQQNDVNTRIFIYYKPQTFLTCKSY